MYRRYRSYSWDQDMPTPCSSTGSAEGLQTGLFPFMPPAATTLPTGQAAPTGCVHLSPENAATLYKLIQARTGYRGQVPRFAYNAATQTMSNHGRFMRNAATR